MNDTTTNLVLAQDSKGTTHAADPTNHLAICGVDQVTVVLDTQKCDNPDTEHPGFPCNHPAWEPTLVNLDREALTCETCILLVAEGDGDEDATGELDAMADQARAGLEYREDNESHHGSAEPLTTHLDTPTVITNQFDLSKLAEVVAAINSDPDEGGEALAEWVERILGFTPDDDRWEPMFDEGLPGHGVAGVRYTLAGVTVDMRVQAANTYNPSDPTGPEMFLTPKDDTTDLVLAQDSKATTHAADGINHLAICGVVRVTVDLDVHGDPCLVKLDRGALTCPACILLVAEGDGDEDATDELDAMADQARRDDEPIWGTDDDGIAPERSTDTGVYRSEES